MSTIHRTRAILDVLNEAEEHLKEYADTAWLDVNRSTRTTIMSGAEEQASLQEAITQFVKLSATIENLIRGEMDETEEREIDQLQSPKPERLVVELDKRTRHTLNEDFTYKRPYAIRFSSGQAAQLNTWQSIYRWFLSHMAGSAPDLFRALPDSDFSKTSRGAPKVSTRKTELRKAIDIADLFFEGNYSANDIRDRILELLPHFNLQLNDVGIYLRQDRDA